jgi:chromosome segregation ATPase
MEAVRQEIKETRDLVNKIREDRKGFEEAAFGGTMGQPRNRLEDTLKEIETQRAVRELQRAVDANLDDVPGTQRAAKELEKAVDAALKDEGMDDLDARMNRLEMMMITASEQLTRVKGVVNHLSDVLEEMREPVEKVVF